MLCCVCKERDAKVHLTQIVGDKMQKADVCEDCAGKKGISDMAGASLADLLLALGASQETIRGSAPEVQSPHSEFTVSKLVRRDTDSGSAY